MKRISLTELAREPGPGSTIVLHGDDHADGTAYERVEVEEALPPKGTRRWKPTAIPGLDDVSHSSYSTWTDVLANALMGSHTFAWVEVNEPVKVPELWWTPILGVMEKVPGGWVQAGHRPGLYHTHDRLPEDAVKLIKEGS